MSNRVTKDGTHPANVWQEEKEGAAVDIPIEYEDVVDAMLQYLYTSDYSTTTTSYGKPYAHPPIVLDVLVYTLALAVEILPLAEKAAFSFCKRAETDWATPGFAQAVRELYERVADKDRKLRNKAISIAGRHAKELIHESYGAEFRAVVKEVKAFGADIQSAAIVRGGG